LEFVDDHPIKIDVRAARVTPDTLIY